MEVKKKSAYFRCWHFGITIETFFSPLDDFHMFVCLCISRSPRWERSSEFICRACRTSWVWFSFCVSPGSLAQQGSWSPSPSSSCVVSVWVTHDPQNFPALYLEHTCRKNRGARVSPGSSSFKGMSVRCLYNLSSKCKANKLKSHHLWHVWNSAACLSSEKGF